MRKDQLLAGVRARRGMPIASALAVMALIACSDCKGNKTNAPKPDGGTGGTQAGPVGPYFNIVPGPLVGNVMQQAVAGKNAACMGPKEAIWGIAGDVDMINVPTGSQQGLTSFSVSAGQTSALDSLVVGSVGGSDRAVFVEPQEGNKFAVGELAMFTLANQKPTASSVPEPTDVPAGLIASGGYVFGAGSILYVDNFEPETGIGFLGWSNGTAATKLGQSATLSGIVESADGSSVIAIVNMNLPVTGATTNVGMGDLVFVDMATGNSQLINEPVGATSTPVETLSESYALANPTCTSATRMPPLPADCELGLTGDPSFSISRDGLVVAYERSGAVHVWQLPVSRTGTPTDTELPCPTGNSCRFPGLSSTGEKVAFFAVDQTSGTTGGNSSVQVYSLTGNSPVNLASIPASGDFAPVFSPDEQFVAYLTDLNVEGTTPHFGGELGTVMVVALNLGTTNPTPVAYAANALWRSLSFWPPEPLSGSPQQTQEISILANMRTVDTPKPNAGGIGDLLVDNPYTMFSENAPAAGEPIAHGIAAADFGALPASGGFAALVPTGNGVLTMQVWIPGTGSTQHAGLTDLMMVGNAATSTLHTSASIPALNGTEPNSTAEDFAIFSVNAAETAQSCSPFSGTLFGLTSNDISAGNAQLLSSNVIDAALTPDGRVLVIKAPDSTNAATNQIWILQF